MKSHKSIFAAALIGAAIFLPANAQVMQREAPTRFQQVQVERAVDKRPSIELGLRDILEIRRSDRETSYKRLYEQTLSNARAQRQNISQYEAGYIAHQLSEIAHSDVMDRVLTGAIDDKGDDDLAKPEAKKPWWRRIKVKVYCKFGKPIECGIVISS